MKGAESYCAVLSASLNSGIFNIRQNIHIPDPMIMKDLRFKSNVYSVLFLNLPLMDSQNFMFLKRRRDHCKQTSKFFAFYIFKVLPCEQIDLSLR